MSSKINLLVFIIIVTFDLLNANEDITHDMYKPIIKNLNENKYSDAYIIHINSYDLENKEMYLKHVVRNQTKIRLNSKNSPFKKISISKLERNLAKSYSYLVFLFKKNNLEGIVLHYHEAYGHNTLKVFPASIFKGKLMISGRFNIFHYDISKIKNDQTQNIPIVQYGIKIENWQSSSIHRLYLKSDGIKSKRVSP